MSETHFSIVWILDYDWNERMKLRDFYFIFELDKINAVSLIIFSFWGDEEANQIVIKFLNESLRDNIAEKLSNKKDISKKYNKDTGSFNAWCFIIYVTHNEHNLVLIVLW